VKNNQRENNNLIVDIMATAAVEEHSCVTPNCGGKAKLRCPNCVKLGILDGSYFCSQDCFKGYWSEHKKLHGPPSM
jgi:methionyl aminopeptidase